MIPTLTFDLTSTLAVFGWAGLGATVAGFAAIITGALRARPKSAPRPVRPAVPAVDRFPAAA
jgi:hypothetical protein